MNEVVTRVDLDALAAAVAARSRAVAAAVRRVDGLLPDGLLDADAAGAQDRRDLVLRLLRVAGDPDAHAVLRVLAECPRPSAQVAAALGRGRVGLWETVSDLVACGLAEHDATRDALALTPAGRAVLDLVATCCSDVRDGGPT